MTCLAFGAKVRQPRSRLLPSARRASGQNDCRATAATPGRGVAPSARRTARPRLVARYSGCQIFRRSHVHLFSTSSRFISSLASIVHAASSAGVERRVGLRLADGEQLLRVVGLRLVVRRASRSRIASRSLRSFASNGRASSARRDEVEPRIARSAPSFSAVLGQVRGRPRRTAGRSASPAPAAACWSARGGRCRSRALGALKMSIDAGGALRFQNVYRLRR